MALENLAEHVGATTSELALRMSQSFSVRDIAAMLGVSPQRVSQVAPKRRQVARPTSTVRLKS